MKTIKFKKKQKISTILNKLEIDLTAIPVYDEKILNLYLNSYTTMCDYEKTFFKLDLTFTGLRLSSELKLLLLYSNIARCLYDDSEHCDTCYVYKNSMYLDYIYLGEDFSDFTLSICTDIKSAERSLIQKLNKLK